MENLYNARLTFNGEGSFTFTLPKYGDLTIYQGRDIYVKGLTTNGVEALRQLRPLLLDHKLNAKPEGCFKVIDLGNGNQVLAQQVTAKKEQVQSVADMKKELAKGPIVENEPLLVTTDAILSEEEADSISEEDIIDVKAPEVTIKDESKKKEDAQVKPKETKTTKTTKAGKSKSNKKSVKTKKN